MRMRPPWPGRWEAVGRSGDPVKAKLGTLVRLVLTPVLLFLGSALVWTLTILPVNMDPRLAVFPLLAGFLSGLAIFGIRIRFVRLYVLGHELTHYVTAKLFLRRTGGFRIGGNRGSVEVDNPNTWIVLSPYIVPLYTVAWIGLYGLCRMLWVPFPAWAFSTFYAGVGITYAFHVVLTLLALRQGQQDLQLYGTCFSLALIFCGNAALLFLALVVAGQHWGYGFETLWECMVTQWDGLLAAGQWASNAIRERGLTR